MVQQTKGVMVCMLLLGRDGFVCWGVHVWVVGVTEILKVICIGSRVRLWCLM